MDLNYLHFYGKKLKRGLSAGRVQSVAVRLIVERENEINKFESSSSFKIISSFKTENGEIFSCELNQKFDNIENVREFLINSSNFQHVLNKIEKKPSKRSHRLHSQHQLYNRKHQENYPFL